MSPILSGSSALQRIKLGDALEICNGILSDFYSGLPHIYIYIYEFFTFLFTADYINIMESLVFNGSATSDRQCVNITILDDDIPEGRFSEVFTVRILPAEENENEILLQNSQATIQIDNDDRKLNISVINTLLPTSIVL